MKNGGKRAARSRGFMLIELMMAIVLLGIAFAGLSPLTIAAVRSMGHGRQVTTESEFARDKIEDIRATDYAMVTGGSDTVTEGGTGAAYARTWTLAAGPAAGTKLVTVTVESTAGAVHTVSLQTLIAQ
jgi:prepilin-type N-terminal cleavage/methylation domain-containing protein